MAESDPTQHVADQRAAERTEVTLTVRLHLEDQEVVGTTRDASAAGVMFVSDAPLRVRVEVVEDGKLVERTGRLARVQRMNAGEVAYAVELDEA